MRARRLGRLLVEMAFLAALAALAAVARLAPEGVVGVMVFGWVVVALAEWSWWLDRPHFGHGLPPRFYVPQVSLPSPLPREHRAVRLPAPGDRLEVEQTRVDPSPNWASAFEEWPVFDPSEIGDDTEIAPAVLEAPPPPPPQELEPAAPVLEAATELFELRPPAAAEPAAPPPPLTPAEPAAPARSLPPARDPGPVRLPPLEPPYAPAVAPGPGAPAEPEPPAEAAAPAEPGPPVEAAPAPLRLARHRVDPFAPLRAPRWRRAPAGAVVEVADRPPADRPPPSVRPREAEQERP